MEKSKHKPKSGDRPPNKNKPKSMRDKSMVLVYGIHSVQHCLKSRKCFDLYITQKVLDEDFSGFDLRSVNVHVMDRKKIDQILAKTIRVDDVSGIVHQGCLVTARPLSFCGFDESINSLSEKKESLILILDQLTDPHNLGAIVRSAAAFEVDLIILSDKNSPDLNNQILVKTACGGVEYVKFASVVNIKKTLDSLKDRGYWSFALDERGQDTISSISLKKYEKLALVMGAEGKGVRRLVKESCDGLVRLETNPNFPTLNVSNATAISLHQVRVS